MTAETIALSLLIGVIGSLLASLAWLLTLRRLHPKLELSDFIAFDPANSSWHIKIINRSRRAVVDIQFEAVRIRLESARGGSVKMRSPLRIGEPPMVIPGFRKRTSEHDNCYRIRIFDDPATDMGDDRHLRLRVFARDEVSGIGRVFERSYHYPPSDIKDGTFARGQDFRVN